MKKKIDFRNVDIKYDECFHDSSFLGDSVNSVSSLHLKQIKLLALRMWGSDPVFLVKGISKSELSVTNLYVTDRDEFKAFSVFYSKDLPVLYIKGRQPNRLYEARLNNIKKAQKSFRKDLVYHYDPTLFDLAVSLMRTPLTFGEERKFNRNYCDYTLHTNGVENILSAKALVEDKEFNYAIYKSPLELCEIILSIESYITLQTYYENHDLIVKDSSVHFILH